MKAAHLVLMLETLLILFFSANLVQSSSIPNASMINPWLQIDMKVPSKPRKLLNIPSCATWSKNETIVAGSRNGTAGNDSMALNNPGALDIDSDGNLYIVDYGNNRVMQWKNGTMSGIQIGGFIDKPQEITVSSTKNIFLTDYNEMYKYDSITNSWITIIRKLPRIAMGFYVNEYQSLIYVDSYGDNIIMSYNLDGTPIGIVAGVESEDGNDSYHLIDPSDVFVDEYNSYFYVADSVNDRIQRYKIGEKRGVTVAGVAVGCEIDTPVRVIVTSNGDIYALELFKNRIMKVTNNYKPKCVCLAGCSDSQQLHSISNFQFDRHGNLYVIYLNTHIVLKFGISLDNCSLESESPVQVKRNDTSLSVGVIIIFLTVVVIVMIATNWSRKKFKVLEFSSDKHGTLMRQCEPQSNGHLYKWINSPPSYFKN